MGSKRFYNVIFAFFMFFAFLSSVNKAYSQDEFVPDQLVIRLEQGANLPDIVDELAEDGINIVDSIQELNVYVLQVPVEELQDIQNSLSLNPNFEYVSKNHVVTANATPNDSSYGLQTHFDLIDAEQAWDNETGNTDVVIAVIDSGVEATHEDLDGKVLPGCSTLGGFNENNCDTNTNDNSGHGSGVAGTASALTNNGIGVAGVCWNCLILPVKVLESSVPGGPATGTDVDVTQGILFAKNYALANPTKKVIINMSLGRNCESLPLDPAMQDAINLAWDAGVLVVTSAGNSGTNSLQCPASADNVIAVSATNNFDQLSDFSTFGNFVDLAAPGGNVSPFHFVYNVEGNTGNGYTGWVGTSFSSPIVAGLAGLIWSKNMSLTNSQVDIILKTTADNIGSSCEFGDGRVNANAAVIAAGGPAPTPTPVPPFANPVLTELDPGSAGGSSNLMVTNVPPGSNAFFYYSLNTGSQVVFGGSCTGKILLLNNPKFINSASADGSGKASINVPIPQIADGITLHLQTLIDDACDCYVSNRVSQTIGSNPPSVNLVLSPLNPGEAGGTSTLQVTGAPPGETIKFKYSFNTGSSAISGGTCNGQNLDINSQKNIGMTSANGSGVATLNVPIPLIGAGITLHMQAYTDTGGNCGISNRVTQVLQ